MNKMGEGYLVAGFVLLVLIMVVIAVLLFIFWIWMLLDCLKRDFKNDSDKIVWALVVIFLGAIGAAIYYFAVLIKDKGAEKVKVKKK